MGGKDNKREHRNKQIVMRTIRKLRKVHWKPNFFIPLLLLPYTISPIIFIKTGNLINRYYLYKLSKKIKCEGGKADGERRNLY